MQNIFDTMMDNNETWIFVDDSMTAVLIPNKEYIVEN